MVACKLAAAVFLLALARPATATSIGNYLSDTPPQPTQAAATATTPEAIYYQEPVDVASASLQLQGTNILPLTPESQQRATTAVALAVGQGVVADNVTVVAQGMPGVNATLACRIEAPATASSAVLNSLEAAARNGSLASALQAQGLQLSGLAATGFRLSLRPLLTNSEPPNTVTRLSGKSRSVAQLVPRWAVWALLASSVVISIAVIGTYVWCFCCGCCCAGRAAAKDMAFQPNNSKPAMPQKRPHRHDSGVDIYANAVFPSITPGMMEGRLTMPKARSPRAAAIKFPPSARAQAAPQPQIIVKEVV